MEVNLSFEEINDLYKSVHLAYCMVKDARDQNDREYLLENSFKDLKNKLETLIDSEIMKRGLLAAGVSE